MRDQNVERLGLHVQLERTRVVQELRHHSVETIHLVDDDRQHLLGILGEVFILQVLSGSLHTREGGADLVRKPGRHIPEGGETVLCL